MRQKSAYPRKERRTYVVSWKHSHLLCYYRNGCQLAIRGEAMKSISEQFEEIKVEMCDKYCRFPELTKEISNSEEEAYELLIHIYCENCPLSRL